MKRLSAVKNKAFLSIYGLTLMPLVLLFVSTIAYSIQLEIKNESLDPSLHLCELYAIQYVKNALYTYTEEDEMISYNKYNIHLDYEDITCYIQIEKEGIVYIQSCLQWDDIENVVVSYTYE